MNLERYGFPCNNFIDYSGRKGKSYTGIHKSELTKVKLCVPEIPPHFDLQTKSNLIATGVFIWHQSTTCTDINHHFHYNHKMSLRDKDLVHYRQVHQHKCLINAFINYHKNTKDLPGKLL